MLLKDLDVWQLAVYLHDHEGSMLLKVLCFEEEEEEDEGARFALRQFEQMQGEPKFGLLVRSKIIFYLFFILLHY